MKLRPFLTFLIAVIAIGTGGAVSAQNSKDCVPLNPPNLSMIVNYTGQCKNAILLGDNSTGNCQSGMVNVAYPNGRVGFAFTINPRIVVVLTGSKSTRPTEKLFHLEIDRMLVTRNGAVDTSLKDRVKGTCTLNTSNIESAIIKCDVVANGKDVVLEFATSGTPKITKFCPPR